MSIDKAFFKAAVVGRLSFFVKTRLGRRASFRRPRWITSFAFVSTFAFAATLLLTIYPTSSSIDKVVRPRGRFTFSDVATRLVHGRDTIFRFDVGFLLIVLQVFVVHLIGFLSES